MKPVPGDIEIGWVHSEDYLKYEMVFGMKAGRVAEHLRLSRLLVDS